MRRNRSVFCILFAILAFGFVAPGTAQEAESGPGFSLGLTATIGAETLDDVNYQLLGLIPDLGYGPFGVGLDLSFHFRFYERPDGPFGFYMRAKDWWDSSLSTSQNVDKYLSRLAYLRWGHKGDPLFIQAGLLPSTTLGTGFLVGGYTNGALRPALKYIGVQFDASGELIDLPYGGFESFVGNLSTFDVLGARLYVKPFGLTNPDVAFLKEVQFGFTFAGDTHVYAQSEPSKSASVYTTAVDTVIPLYGDALFTAAITGDLAFEGNHTGGAVGLGGQALSFLRWGIQNRFLGDNFLPGYFDRGYEINRVDKYLISSSDEVLVPGTLGWLATLGAGFLEDKISFGVTLSGPWTPQDELYAQTQLQSHATLQPGVLPVSLEAFYIKQGLSSFAELISPRDALVGSRLGYTLGAVLITVVYDLRYLSAQEAEAGDRWVTSSRIETSVKF